MSPDPNDPFGKRSTQDRGHIQREKTAAENALSTQFHSTGAKPAFVAFREVFESVTDATLNAGIRAIVPEELNASLTSWAQATDGLDQDFANVHKANLNVAEFQGRAASAAMAASAKFAASGVTLTDNSTQAKTRIEAIFHAASAVKMAAREIPPKPARPDYGSITDILGNGPKEAAYNDAKRQTLYAVNSILKPGFWPAGDGVPSYAAPPAVVADPGGGAPGGPGQQAPGPGGVGGQTPSHPVPNRAPGAEATTAANNAPTALDSAASPGLAGNQLGSAGAQPAGAAAVNAANAAANQVPGAGAGITGGYYPQPGHSGRNNNDRREQNDSNQSLVAGAVGRPVATAATPMTGTTGTPGMAPPRPAAKKDDKDHERKTPAHLITAQNGSDLLGPAIKATPPVLGDWDYANDRPIDRSANSPEKTSARE